MLSNKVSEIMTREVIAAAASSTISDVTEMMVAKNVGGLIITEDEAPVGIFTEQDVLKRVMNKKLDPKKTAIKKVMTAPIQAADREDHIVEVLAKMYQGKFRHLLVRGKEGEIVGIVSMRDILKLVVELGRGLEETRTIGSIMSSSPITVDGDRSVYETIETMVKKHLGCVVILSGGEPKGIFTERDVLKRVAIKNVDTRKTPIRDVMTANVVSMEHTALIGDVLAEMHRKGFRHMPIQGERGEIVGIVSMGEVLKYARALDVDESVRKAWKEIEEFWDSEEHYTPG